MIDFVNKWLYSIKLKRFVRDNLNKGFTTDQIKSHLINYGISPEESQKLINDVVHRKTLKRLIFVSVVLLIILFLWLFITNKIPFLFKIKSDVTSNSVYTTCNKPVVPMERFECFKKNGLYVQDDSFCTEAILSETAPECIDLADSQIFDCYAEKIQNEPVVYPCGIHVLMPDTETFMFREEIIKALNGERVTTMNEWQDITRDITSGEIIIVQTTSSIYKTEVKEDWVTSYGLVLAPQGQAFCRHDLSSCTI